jgi:hypothetical protein
VDSFDYTLSDNDEPARTSTNTVVVGVTGMPEFWAKALKGGVPGLAQQACSELVVAAIKEAISAYHDFQIANQVDGLLRYKKSEHWMEFSRTGRVKVAVIYQFSDSKGTITEVPYPALVRCLEGFVEVEIVNPRTSMSLQTIKTKLKAKQLTANEWACEGWPTYK